MDPLRIALLYSRHAPGAARLLADPNRGATWELTIAVGSEPDLVEAPLFEQAGIPLEIRPIRTAPAFRNLNAREDYDEQLGDLLARLKIDYLLLDGWQYVVTTPMLELFPSKILAIHDADLTLRDHERLYAGPHAVRDAVFGGERETRSSVYILTREIARGPIFLLSGAYPLAPMALDARERGDASFLTSYAALHRQWMVDDCWGAMLTRSLELLAGGSMRVIGDTVWIDGAPAPCRFGESPASCHEPETMVARGIPRSCPFIG